MLPYRFSARADQDLSSVRNWYDRIDVTLGDRVTNAIFEAVDWTRERPETFPEVAEGVRAARCRRFPYRIYFAVTTQGVNVLAIYHTARAPERWDDPDRD